MLSSAAREKQAAVSLTPSLVVELPVVYDSRTNGDFSTATHVSLYLRALISSPEGSQCTVCLVGLWFLIASECSTPHLKI